ncbi:signal peptide peptidase SppA [Psychromonas sp. Urea-02u-13]|uniref:signal peptide peptidase SppA n=1 Tax=Psychromonas sp. Urea-02u-13 TaxID=2058326 RepID=UPI000C32725F|nr:signal peptide peptidase SppA [Psychromonas sp. Urea-02u-13]PKG39591.1 signal peptide peptidase SppA [Psychromonas sp. Urea-02u-13]
MKGLFKLFKAAAKLFNITRLIIINSIFFIIVLIFVVALGSEDEQVTIAENSILQLNFNGNIVEQKQPVDFSAALSKQLMSDNEKVSEYAIDEVLQVIRHAQHDPKVDSILLDLSGLQSASLNNINSIGRALDQFKSNNKNIVATADSYSQIQYLLASYADDIYLDPQGMVLLQGFSVYRLYFKELLDNLLITPHIFKVGTFKSFVEPFTDKQMSKASKIANSHWLNQLWQGYIETVITQRQGTNITAQSVSPTLIQLNKGLKKAQGNTAKYAQQVGLVDQLLPRYKVLKKLEQDDAQWISYTHYQSTMPALYEQDITDDLVALIHGQGEILAGTQASNAIGGDSFSKLLQNALKNKRVKAVVIRLDTPGGSAFASEKIRQHVLDLKAAGKPVVVSMGSVSASGGYWIASAADHLIASPTTLTGSIGIFGMFASVDKALNKLGIYNDGVGTSPLSSIDPTRELDPALAEILQLGIESGYKQFLSVVSEGRGMSLEEVDKVAQGRVWTGVDAKSLGLVDQLGSLQDAINQAATLAKLSDYKVQPIKKTISAKQQLVNEIFSTGIKMIPQSLQVNPVLFSAFDTVQKQTTLITTFNDPKGHYLYCPMCFINN